MYMVISYTSSNRFVIHIFPKPNFFILSLPQKESLGVKNLQKNHHQKSDFKAWLGRGFKYFW